MIELSKRSQKSNNHIHLIQQIWEKIPSKNSLMEYIFWNKSLIHIYIYQSYKEYHILKDTYITHFLLGKSYNWYL